MLLAYVGAEQIEHGHMIGYIYCGLAALGCGASGHPAE
jgi:hypothetical protein